jgi:hypothetical protein
MKAPKKIWMSKEQIDNCISEIDKFTVDLDCVDYNIELVKGYRNIIVVGPQRSGTTFTAKAIAKDLNYSYVDEADFRIRDVNKFKNLNKKRNKVFQAPALTYKIHKLIQEDDLVIFMVRKWSDILNSQNKRHKGKLSQYLINESDMYDHTKSKYIEFDSNYNTLFDTHINESDKYYLNPIYKAWKYYQSDIIKNSLALNYTSMDSHKMWVAKKDRENFKVKQTAI